MIIHADEEGEKKSIETFVVGQNVSKGEKLRWIVEAGNSRPAFAAR